MIRAATDRRSRWIGLLWWRAYVVFPSRLAERVMARLWRVMAQTGFRRRRGLRPISPDRPPPRGGGAGGGIWGAPGAPPRPPPPPHPRGGGAAPPISPAHPPPPPPPASRAPRCGAGCGAVMAQGPISGVSGACLEVGGHRPARHARIFARQRLLGRGPLFPDLETAQGRFKRLYGHSASGGDFRAGATEG